MGESNSVGKIAERRDERRKKYALIETMLRQKATYAEIMRAVNEQLGVKCAPATIAAAKRRLGMGTADRGDQPSRAARWALMRELLATDATVPEVIKACEDRLGWRPSHDSVYHWRHRVNRAAPAKSPRKTTRSRSPNPPPPDVLLPAAPKPLNHLIGLIHERMIADKIAVITIKKTGEVTVAKEEEFRL